MKHQLFKTLATMVAAVLVASCTMKKQEAPPMTGPSEFGTSVNVSVSPDILTQDGASQSVVTVSAMNSGGQPVRNMSLRTEIQVNFQPVDHGSLSARNIVTDSNGRATFVYTAPRSNGTGVDTYSIVTICVTPVGSDFLNSAPRYASIRLVPQGVVLPPDGLQPVFTFAPTQPSDNQQVLFDATPSQSSQTNPIRKWEWNIGDGDRGEGRTVGHSFEDPGTYIVTLTISDEWGRSASTSQPIDVGPGLAPGAVFTFSPTEPLPTDQINFNAAQSRAAPGRRIVSYKWDMGDGSPAKTGVQVSHTYNKIGTFVVTLTVVDDVGRVGTATRDVPVGVSEDDEGGL